MFVTTVSIDFWHQIVIIIVAKYWNLIFFLLRISEIAEITDFFKTLLLKIWKIVKILLKLQHYPTFIFMLSCEYFI